MLNTSLGRWLALSFAASSIASLASTAVAEDDPRDVSRLLPPTTLAYLEIPNPDSIAETILGHPIRARLESMPQYDQVAKSQQYAQAQVGLAMVEGLFGMPLREVVQNTTANGVVAIRDGATDGAAVILTAKDKESAKTVFEKAMQVASIEWFNGLEPVEYRGITAYKKRDVRVAIHEDRILITNNSDLGRFILDQMLEPSGESLHDDPAFQAAKQTQSNEADAWAYVILDPFRSKGKFEKLHRDVRRNPVAEALVGGLLSCLDETPYATAEVDLTTTGLGLQFVIPFVESAIPSEREYYFGPDHAGVGPAIPQQPQQLLSLSTYRDFSAMWLHSGDLFDERINDEFAKADATLTTIFSGHDFGEDILGSVEPGIGFVAVRQEFADGQPVPAIKLPAFALLMKMENPDEVSREFKRIFQSLVGFINIIGAQEGNRQLELDLDKLDGGAQLVISRFVPEREDEGSTDAPIVFNFSPTLGFSGDRLVLASTTDLAKRLTVSEEPASSETQANTQLLLSADVLQKVVVDNRSQLVAQNMLEEGNSLEEAQATIDFITNMIGYFKSAKVTFGPSAGKLKLAVDVEVNTDQTDLVSE